MVAKWVAGIEIVERTAGEILVSRPGDAESYVLNQTAGHVFDLCEHGYSKLEMAKVIHDRSGLPADERVVDLALRELADAGLVVLDGPPPVGMTPRALMRQLSLSGAAECLLPAVETIVVISPAGS
jgi:hypothetical protein